MSDESFGDLGQPAAEVIPPEKDEFAELRQLLLSREQSQIDKINQRVSDPKTRAKDVAHVLSEAVGYRSREDKTLVPALMGTVEEILRASVRRDPRTIVDCLFPVMGPAIRKSVGHFLSDMVQSMNQALEHGLSLRGLGWRIESWRTGKPFAEVVLLHSLVYRVEQVFLIHGETGLLLGHVSAESVVFEDADMVSGMLTAIRDFVRDSFKPGREDELENLRVGELTVVVEQGPLAYIAAVIRGTPSSQLRIVFKEALEAIHLHLGEALESFDGDAAPFQAAGGLLDDCLQHRYGVEKQKRFGRLIAAVCVLVVAAAYWIGMEIAAGMRWDRFTDRLRKEKGIVVISAERSGGKHTIVGMRDPSARDPKTLLEGSGLDHDSISWYLEPFQALEPQFVLARAGSALNPPGTVTLTLEGDVLAAVGTAPYDWIKKAEQSVRFLPGIMGFRNGLTADYGLVLQRIKHALSPPNSVSVTLEDGVLSMAGTAPREWIENARLLVGVFPEITAVADKNLVEDPEPVLARIRRILAAPDTVALSLKNGTLKARGTAPYEWAGEAGRLASILPDVTKYDDAELALQYDHLLAKIKRISAPPDTVSLKMTDGVLRISGTAPHKWIIEMRRAVRSFSEVSGYNEKDLTDMDEARLAALKTGIDGTTIGFDRNTDRVAPEQEHTVTELVFGLRSLRATGEVLGRRFHVEVKGHSDSLGSEAANLALSLKRAERIAALLVAGGVPQADLLVKGAGAAEPVISETSEKERALNRRVSFTVVFAERRDDGVRR
ncbi:MAG: OmpA family protein [Pseudomonadota bacterium]